MSDQPGRVESPDYEFLWHEAEERGDRLAFLLRAAREVVDWHSDPRCAPGVICDDCILLTRIDAELDGTGVVIAPARVPSDKGSSS